MEHTKEKEKISVIVPIYNVEEYLERCVDSLINQTYDNYEVILVDDCSTDNSASIAQYYAEEYKDICRFIQREENGRLSAARNSGMSAAEGKWVTFVDSDDWVTDDYLETMYDVAKRDDADIVMSSIYYYYYSGKCKENCPFGNLTTESSHKEKVALGGPPYACTRLFRRTLFEEKGLCFQEDIWRAAEMATTIPLLTTTDKISIVHKPMYYYFQRSNSNSNQYQKNVDISFYPKTVLRMIELSQPGFETELQFRAVSEIMYGMIMIMVRSGRSREEISRQVDWFNAEFVDWQDNHYLSKLQKGKWAFIWFAARKHFMILKCLIWAWDLKQKL